jgi:hypothetical protein
MKQMSTRLFMYAFVTLLWIPGCSKDGSNPVMPKASNEIWPLAIGNLWIMQNYDVNMYSQYVLSSVDSIRIAGDKTIQGDRWYSTDELGIEYLTGRSDGIWISDSRLGTALMFKYPVSLNEAYAFITGNAVGGFDTATVKVLSLSQSVKVPAGTFTCVTYQATTHYSATLDQIRTWQMAPGTGPVFWKTEFKNLNTGKMENWWKAELLGYSLK